MNAHQHARPIQDSLGGLLASRPASSESKPPPNESAVGRLLDRLSANLGAPFGRDESGLRQMRRDWAAVLDGCTEIELDAAVLYWLKTHDTWPKPANIRQTVIDARPRQSLKAWKDEFLSRDPDAQVRTERMLEIMRRHTKAKSKTPFTDTINDPAYQAVLADYKRATGRDPA